MKNVKYIGVTLSLMYKIWLIFIQIKYFLRNTAMMLDKIIELENVFYDCVVCHMTQ